MADAKISALTAKTTVADTDMFVLVDEEATPDTTKKITGANMKSQMTSAHADLTTGVHGVPTSSAFGHATSAAVNLYVDAAAGNDANAGTSGSPKATIKGALDALPPIIAHACTIHVRGPQNYAENNVALEFSRFSTLASITIKTVNSSDENMYDNGLATSGANTTLTQSTKAWSVDQFNGAYIWIYEGTGRGQVRTISDTTATVITVSAAWDTNPDATSYYAIGGGATMTGTAATHITIAKNVDIYGFRHTGSTTYDVTYGATGQGLAYYNYFAGTVRGMLINFAATPRYCYFHCTTNGIVLARGLSSIYANVFLRSGAVGGAAGIVPYRYSLVVMLSNNGLRNFIKDWVTGLSLLDGGGATATSGAVFDNCTNDIDPSTSTIVPRWWT